MNRFVKLIDGDVINILNIGHIYNEKYPVNPQRTEFKYKICFEVIHEIPYSNTLRFSCSFDTEYERNQCRRKLDEFLNNPKNCFFDTTRFIGIVQSERSIERQKEKEEKRKNVQA